MKRISTIFVVCLIFSVVCAQETADTGLAQKGHKSGNRIDLSNFELIFSDEFDGKRLDWDVWVADDPKNIKRETSRGREAVSVKDGELRMNIKKVNREKVQWLACYLYLKQPLERNVYVECRFKSGAATGVNNSFWMACKTPPNNSYQNRYEIDVVEARKNIETGEGSAHLAWHDWKTISYAVNKDGKKIDIAQGISVAHDFDDYNVWGFWYGENEMIFYLNGDEMWRGKTHPLYTDQYCSGVGKAPKWNPLEQARAYGNYGQTDWCYYGGYNGDRIHVILANLPWGDKWTPLVEKEADGTYMAVDYVRIYKPKKMLVSTPDFSTTEVRSTIELNKIYSLAEDNNIYFSTVITKKENEELEQTLLDDNNNEVAKIIVDASGYLLTGITKLTSNQFSESAFKGKIMVVDNEPTLLVGRITAKKEKGLLDKDAISVWCIPLSKLVHVAKIEEPYFYPNIDDFGNTSITNEWYINQKGYSDETIHKIRFSSSKGTLSSYGAFRIGSNFISVIHQ